MTQPLIQFEQVYKQFGDHRVLNGVDFDIYPGKITAVIGKSGEGKSVLLKHIIGLIRYDTGRILYQGKPMRDMNRKDRKELRSKFSYMFQGNALFDSMTIFENIALPLKEKNKLSKTVIQKQVFDKMAQLDLKDMDHKYPSQLSGGMQKRVALARALITEPEIILFDEPTTGLDPVRKKGVHGMIADYQKKFGFTAVVVSHEIPDIFYVAHHVAMLDEGRIIFAGTPEEIDKSSNPVIKSFMQGMENGVKDRIE